MLTLGRPSTLCEAFQMTALVKPDAIAVRTVGGVETLRWREYGAQVRSAAASLAALGIRRGDSVALLMANRIEFYPIDVGAQHLGATPFSLYNTLSVEQLAFQLDNAGAQVLFCERQYLDRVRSTGIELKQLICIDGVADGAITLEEFYQGASNDFDFETSWQAVQPDDVATLIYTSGTTGNPKGVEVTHANLMYQAYAATSVLDIEFGDRTPSYLPSAHIADRATGLYTQEIFGTEITVVPDGRKIIAALPDVRPTVWVAVPRIWEKLRAAIEYEVDHAFEPARRPTVQWAMLVAANMAATRLADRAPSQALAEEWDTADRLVLSELRALVGLEQLRWAVSGAAPIPAETLAFFAGIGVPITELWGMSELSCTGAVCHPREARLGTVGRLLPGLEGKNTDDGEFLVRGPVVMKGYRDDPAATADAIDSDGWLHTGDVITADADGYLRVVDRKKELIVNSAGKNMSPANIENTILAACPLVGAMATIGDGRPYNTALLVLQAERLEQSRAESGLIDAPMTELASNRHLLARIAADIAQANSRLSRVEQIKRFMVLPTLWEAGGDELTPTMKLKRRTIMAKYAKEIDELYEPEPGPLVCEPEVRAGP